MILTDMHKAMVDMADMDTVVTVTATVDMVMADMDMAATITII